MIWVQVIIGLPFISLGWVLNTIRIGFVMGWDLAYLPDKTPARDER